jgi:2-hydroxy-6-oxonona-2,4-dienedioate hydrolase
VILLGRRELRERWDTIHGLRVFARVSSPRQASERNPPVVLVHGLGVSSRYMVPLAVELAKTDSVYAPDLPGFGRSERPAAVPSVGELALWLQRWSIQVGIERAVFVANSMGCQIVVELGALAPRLIAAAVLLGPTMDQTACHPLAHVLRLLRDQFREPPELVPLQLFDYLSNGPIRTALTFRHAVRHDMLARAHCLDAPTILLRGERDPIVSQEFVEALARQMPKATVEVIPKAGHALNYNSPTAVAAVVRRLSRGAASRTNAHRELGGSGERAPRGS